MAERKSYTEKQRDKRIQKQVEKLGGPKQPPEVKTLKKASQEQFEKAKLTTRASKFLDAAGYPPATTKDKITGFLKGYVSLYKEKVPKELRDRLKYSKKSTSRRAMIKDE